MSGKPQDCIIYDTASGALLMRLKVDPAIQELAPGQAILVIDSEAWDLVYDTAPEAQAIVLASVSAALWVKVKLLRDARVDGGFAVDGIGTFDSTAQSRENIHGAATGALLAQVLSAPFAVTWTLADNSNVELDGAQMLAVGQAMLAHVNGCYEAARMLRSAIEDPAAAIEDLLQIDVTTGWEG